MVDAPNGNPHSENEKLTERRNPILARNRAVTFALVLLFSGVIGGLMSVLPRHLPGIVVVLIVFVPLMLATTFVFIWRLRLHKGTPFSAVIPVWLVFAGLEAGVVMLIYSSVLDARQDAESAFWWLLGLGLPTVIIAILWPFYLADKRKGQ